MRLIVDATPERAALGLARDEALFDSVREGGVGILRFWVNERSVIIGRGQGIAAEVDLAEAEQEGIPVLRRISGGGTVYHYPGNLNVSLSVASKDAGSVTEAFRQFGGAICNGLARLSVRAEIAGNRLVCCGRKLGGAAQARRGRATLYHSTTLVCPPDRPMARLLLAHGSGYRPNGVASRPEKMTSLAEVADRAISIEEAMDAVSQGMGELFDLEPSVLTEGEHADAVRLANTKYGSASWNASR